MLSIIISAYACSPDMGSEPGMAWNWCVNLAKYCHLHIITEGEDKDKIEAVLPTLPQGKNMNFYYNPVSDRVRQMCSNQGDWRFYIHYNKWQKKTYTMALEIIANNHIDVIHQLNMVGFREPGYLWKITNIPFVWGPVGGLKFFPKTYLRGAGVKMRLFNQLKDYITILQIKYGGRIEKAILRSDLLIASTPDAYRALRKYQHKESIIIPETGCYREDDDEQNIDRFVGENFNLTWVGKFDFRKQLHLALHTMVKVRHLKGIKLSIYGTGSEKQKSHYRQLSKDLGIEEYVEWCGDFANKEILEKMKKTQLFFFTSVSEETSTVVLEALSCSLPILCFDACGFGYVVNDLVGIKIPFTNPSQSINEFADKIEYLFRHREVLSEMSKKCIHRQQELSWDNKAKQMIEIYHQVTSNLHKNNVQS